MWKQTLYAAVAMGLTASPAWTESDRDAQPISPPIPTYPSQAIMKGLSGMCDVHFDVDRKGNVIAPKAHCTAPEFCEASEKAMSQVKFAPKLENGRTVPRYGVVYPLEYVMSRRFDNEGALQPCGGIESAVS